MFYMLKNINLSMFNPSDIVIRPNWLEADSAIYFMSFSYNCCYSRYLVL